jgi:hypothetical protein
MRFFPDMGGCERKIAWICQDFRVTDERAPCPQTRRGCQPLQSVEKFKICRPFKNGEMQGSEKIQGAQCIRTYISGLNFFADAADCHFWAACLDFALGRIIVYGALTIAEPLHA